MKQVKVLGPGCKKCDEAESLVRAVIEKNNIEAEVEKITDFQVMASLGVFSTPAIVIDGTVRVVGRVPREKELQAWLA
jgi:small redox-active disulfide protein 2